MKITVITGSPRKKGNSFAMTEAFVKAAKEHGRTIRRFDAAFLKIGGCHACMTCYIQAAKRFVRLLRLLTKTKYDFYSDEVRKKQEAPTHGFSPCFSLCKRYLLLRIHAHQELLVVFCLLQTVFHKIHCFDRIHVRQVFAENPHAVEGSLVKQQVVATST